MYGILDYYTQLKYEQNKTIRRGEFWHVYYPEFRRDDVIQSLQQNGTSYKIAQDHISRIETDSTTRGQFDALYHFKRRPVVILSTCGNSDCSEWELGQFILVAPIYSLRNQESREYKTSPGFVWEMAMYRYPQLFYLPQDEHIGMHEAVIRLDYMMTIPKAWMVAQRQYCLTDLVFSILDNWLRFFITGELLVQLNRDLETYREQMGSDPSYRSCLFPEKC